MIVDIPVRDALVCRTVSFALLLSHTNFNGLWCDFSFSGSTGLS